MALPELLRSLSGEKIKSRSDWERFRRDEILHLFREYVYGVRKIERPEDLFFKCVSESEEYGMRKKEIQIGFSDFSFPVWMYLPKGKTERLPVLLYILIESNEKFMQFQTDGNATALVNDLPFRFLTERGYAVVLMPTSHVCPDFEQHVAPPSSDFRGVFGAKGVPERSEEHDWSTISAWAWGASRVMDYLETDVEVDAAHVAVVGHSRGGKTALWAAADDPRFFLAVSNNSGCMGAALLRGKLGEHIKEINRSGWFCEKFRSFNDAEEMLPVDQHMLLALIAPRYVYVTSSSEDEWADPASEYRSCHLASEVFSLYGEKGICAPNVEKPCAEQVYQEGHIAYHLKTGVHSISRYDWENILRYFDRIRSK